MLFNILLTPSFLILFLLNPLKNIQIEYMGVKINEKDYKLEVADTKFKQAVGLMFRDFDKTSGMIFLYSSPTNPYYYNKNVRFPLRIYFIGENIEVKATFIMQKDSFKTYNAGENIKYVVEIPLNDDLSTDPGENPEIKFMN